MTAITAESMNTAVAGVLGRMAAGVGATFVVAALINVLGLVPVLFQGILGYVFMFAPLAMSLFLMWRAERMTAAQSRAWFYAFAGEWRKNAARRWDRRSATRSDWNRRHRAQPG